jgi:hypothetical protein
MPGVETRGCTTFPRWGNGVVYGFGLGTLGSVVNSGHQNP